MQVNHYTARFSPASPTAAGAAETIDYNFTDGSAKDTGGHTVIIPQGENIIAVDISGTGSITAIPRTCFPSSPRTVRVGITNLATTAAQLTVDIRVATISGDILTYNY